MLPEFVPNFLATLGHPPWNKTSRHSLYMTIEGEKRIPFSSYVRPSSAITGASSQTSSFSYYNALPSELQIYILTYCSGCTLFQLMKVSSTLRTEASKLFWANTEAYVLIEAQWLLEGGYPGYTHSDLGFLAHVQNVEVDYWQGIDDRICPLHEDGTVEVQQDQITNFWESLVKRCPRAKRVIVNQCWTSLQARKETQCVPRALQHLIQSSPLGVRASAFIVEKGEDLHADTCVTASSAEKWQRAVYQLSAESRWEKIKSKQDWETILAPAKQYNGPVGRFQEIQRRSSLAILYEYGMWPIIVEAVDRYHFDGGINKPFACPSSSCDGYFQKAGEWTIHAAEMHYQESLTGDEFRNMPQAVREEFQGREKRLAEQSEQIEQDVKQVRDEWNEGGEERQREIRRKWIEQLDCDPAWETGEEAEKSRLFYDFWDAIKYVPG